MHTTHSLFPARRKCRRTFDCKFKSAEVTEQPQGQQVCQPYNLPHLHRSILVDFIQWEPSVDDAPLDQQGNEAGSGHRGTNLANGGGNMR
jgi:hypothetical protein